MKPNPYIIALLDAPDADPDKARLFAGSALPVEKLRPVYHCAALRFDTIQDAEAALPEVQAWFAKWKPDRRAVIVEDVRWDDFIHHRL